jgi:tRNA-specific 2-thiouridylase
MSQKYDRMILIERESGFAGLILRPLSAQHFEPTIPEQNGWVDRSKLLAIKGRSRQDQFRLAEDSGIKEYPTPAGGCHLTELSFVPKVKDIFLHSEELDLREFNMLKVGRHFRIGEHTKAIIGRDAADNALLENVIQPDETAFHWLDGNSPMGAVVGIQNEECLELAMRILLRYTKADSEATCRINVRHNGEETIRLVTNNVTEETIRQYRID